MWQQPMNISSGFELFPCPKGFIPYGPQPAGCGESYGPRRAYDFAVFGGSCCWMERLLWR